MGRFPEVTTDAEFLRLLDRRETCLVKFTQRNLEPYVGIARTVNEVGAMLGDRLDLYEIFYDDNKAPFERFMIEDFPCLLFFKEGREIYRLSHLGAHPEDLSALIQGYFGIKV